MGRLPSQFFTADNLFGDESAADMRGFASPDEMDAAMIERWNSVVGADDVVWVLGNFQTANTGLLFELPRKLNGVKYLVAGPLDKTFPPGLLDDRTLRAKVLQYQVVGFKGVVTGAGIARRTGRPVTLPLRTRQDNPATPVIVSHFPYDAVEGERGKPDRFATWRPKRGSGWLLHGHQAEWVVNNQQINVGVDAWDLEPVGTEMVLALIEDAERSC
jgi:calcineurin-like phosphoesterase family protein